MESTRLAAVLVVLVATASSCGKGGGGGEELNGLVGESAFFPYPSIHVMAEDPSTATGWRVDIPADLLPIATSGTPQKVERWSRLDGFSPATPCLLYLEGVSIDPATLPGQADLSAGVTPDGTVQIIDLESGERRLLMAELDAHPQAIAEGRQSLIVRPMETLGWGRHVAVVITDAIRDTSGDPIPSPPGFAALVRGTRVPQGLVPYVAHYEDLFARLEELGLSIDDLFIAWDFWTGTEEVAHAQMDAIIAGVNAEFPADPAFVPTYALRETRCLDSDVDTDVDPMIWRHTELEFQMTTYVDENGEFVLGEDGLPTAQGDDSYILIVHVPPSVHDAPAGTVPVLLFGHGLFGFPDDYLTRSGDSLKALYAAERYGMIFAAAEWRGMSMRDTLDATTAATDFGRFNLVTDDLHMGIASFVASARMFRSGFVDEPFLRATDGSGSLVDQDRIYYMGISLGGHEGGVFMALTDVVDFGILQVGGGPWTTMLERSSNWSDYSIILDSWMRDPVDRQMVIAVTQMFWDPVDPASYFRELAGKSVLMQEAIGDAQMPDISTEFWARSVGLDLVQPSPTHPAGLEGVSGPLPPGSSALFQYDAMARADCGEAPPESNSPPEDNCAHGSIRKFEGMYQQVEAFLEDGAEGTIIHPPACGADPCIPVPTI